MFEIFLLHGVGRFAAAEVDAVGLLRVPPRLGGSVLKLLRGLLNLGSQTRVSASY